MSKFKLDSLGAGLINEKGKAFATEEFKITYLNINQLQPNEKNTGFSMEEIEDLKQSIEEVGLQQNLVVSYNGETYKILSGHRRYEALKTLVNEGKNKFATVPCFIKELSKIELPIDDETKEIYAIATTNAETRKLSDADRLKLMEMLSTVYDRLKENGYTDIGKRRDYIAEKLGISTGKVSMLNFINKNLDEDLKEDFKNEKLPLTAANELAHLNSQEQEKFIEKNNGDISSVTASDIKDYREEIEEKKKKKTIKSESKVDNDTYMISGKDFEYLFNISDTIDELSTGVTVTGKDYKKLLIAKERIIKQQNNIEKILDNAMKNYK